MKNHFFKIIVFITLFSIHFISFAQGNVKLNNQNNDWLLIATNNKTGANAYVDQNNVHVKHINKEVIVDVLMKGTYVSCKRSQNNKDCYWILNLRFNYTQKLGKLLTGQVFDAQTNQLVDDYGQVNHRYEKIPDGNSPNTLAMKAICPTQLK